MQNLYLLLILVYNKLPHKVKVLFDLNDFGFNGDSKKKTDFSLKMLFGRTILKQNLFLYQNQFLVENLYFTVGNVLLLQTVDIPMTIDHAPFLDNLYLYNYESKYTTNLIRTN